MTLGTKPSRTRKWTLPISENELRLKLIRRTGKSSNYRPKPGTEKSTKIVLWDIALLARAHSRSISNFAKGKPHAPGYASAGQGTLRRVNEILDLVNAGLILKTQHGCYHFYETPQVPAVKTMKINLDIGRIIGVVSAPKIPQRMPSFKSVFGDRK